MLPLETAALIVIDINIDLDHATADYKVFKLTIGTECNLEECMRNRCMRKNIHDFLSDLVSVDWRLFKTLEM